jgi:hypothetical protein
MKKDQSYAEKLHNMENGIWGVQNNPEIPEGLTSVHIDGHWPVMDKLLNMNTQ